ncbi:O-antigen ligase [Salinisphaera sp. LB1]|uniref:O-antigen ligase family protein n=1 Tax=Salinisphaera sp. LB1 TaxID=2183911 RepID=UPI0011C4AD0F|nr:hypothetical protein [Salinisphaera sp. LB1]
MHISLTKILGVMTAISVSLSLLISRSRKTKPGLRVPSRASVIVLLILVFDILGVATALGRTGGAIEFAIEQAGALIWVLLPLILIRSRKDLRYALAAYSFAVIGIHVGILLTGFGLLHVDFGQQDNQPVQLMPILLGAKRSAGFLINYGAVAIATAFVLPWILSGVGRKGWAGMWKVAGIFAIGVILAGSIVSLSRNVWLSSSVAISFWFLGIIFTRATGYGKLLSILLGGACVVVLSPILLTALQATAGLAGAVREQSISIRAQQYEGALRKIGKSPLVGWGPNVHIGGLPVHNLILNAILTAGVGGWFLVTALILLFVWLFRSAIRSSRRELLIVFAGFSGVATASMFYPTIGNSAPIFWLTFGIAASALSVHASDIKTGYARLQFVR